MGRCFAVLSGLFVLLFSADGWGLSPCPDNTDVTWTNCTGTFVTSDGGKYVGEWKNDKSHGDGLEFYANGDKYAGRFKKGKPHGFGTYTYANGDKHVGEFRYGLPNGKGRHTAANGAIREGIWKSGNLIEPGKYLSDDEAEKARLAKNQHGNSAPGWRVWDPVAPNPGIPQNNRSDEVKIKEEPEVAWSDKTGTIIRHQTQVSRKKPVQMSQAGRPPVISTRAGNQSEPENLLRHNAKKVQIILKHLGFYDGTVDGILGSGSSKATRKWQESKGLDVTGTLTNDQVIELLKDNSSILAGNDDTKSLAKVDDEGSFSAMEMGTAFVIILLIYFKARPRRDIYCTWCGSRKLKYLEGETGEWFWEYRNKDGSQDKRAKDNYQQASFHSKRQCKNCNAVSLYTHYVDKQPSKGKKVWKGMLLSDGRGERKKTDYSKSKGKTIHTKSAHRKGDD